MAIRYRPFNRQERDYMLSVGKNPDEYEGIEVNIPDDASSIGGTLFRSAKRSAAPAVGGFGAAAAGALAFAPVFPPFGSIIGGIGAGIAGGIGTSLAQEHIAKPLIFSKETLAEDEAQRMADQLMHPTASVIGENIPGLIAMKPSGRNVVSAFKGAKNLITRKPLLPGQGNQLLNVGIGAGVGAGVEAGSSLARGEPLDWKRVGISTLFGGGLNEPNRIGRNVFGFKASPRVADIPIATGQSKQFRPFNQQEIDYIVSLGKNPNDYEGIEIDPSQSRFQTEGLYQDPKPLNRPTGLPESLSPEAYSEDLEGIYKQSLTTGYDPNKLGVSSKVGTSELYRRSAIPELQQSDPVRDARLKQQAELKQQLQVNQAERQSLKRASELAKEYKRGVDLDEQIKLRAVELENEAKIRQLETMEAIDPSRTPEAINTLLKESTTIDKPSDIIPYNPEFPVGRQTEENLATKYKSQTPEIPFRQQLPVLPIDPINRPTPLADEVPYRKPSNLDLLPQDKPVLKPAPAKPVGVQDFGELGKLEMFQLTEDIPGHPKDSTLSERTLRQLGYEPPKKVIAGEGAPVTYKPSMYKPSGELITPPESNTPLKLSVEKWADDTIKEGKKRLNVGADPELLAAYAVKGAHMLRRGVKNLGAELTKLYGDDIKPHLGTIVKNSHNLLKDENWEGGRPKFLKDESSMSEVGDEAGEPKIKFSDIEDVFTQTGPQGKVPTGELPITSKQEQIKPKLGTGSYKAKATADSKRIMDILRKQLYRGDVAVVGLRELFQNAKDVKGVSKIDIDYDELQRTIKVENDGDGMLPEVVTKEFINPGESLKDIDTASGGFGFAKINYLGNAAKFYIETVATDKKTGKTFRTELEGNGKDWMNSLAGEGEGMEVTVTEVYSKNPKTGTKIEIEIEDGSGGEGYAARNFLRDLVNNNNLPIKINATVNAGESSINPVEGSMAHTKAKIGRIGDPVGSLQETSANIDFYRSPEITTSKAVDIRVLNNGAYQFGIELPVNSDMSTKLPKQVIVDVKPNFRPGEGEYPFSANRETLVEEIEEKIKDYIRRKIIDDSLNSRRNVLKDNFQNAPKLKGGKTRVVDTAGDLDKNTGVLKSMAEDDHINMLSDLLLTLAGNIRNALKSEHADYKNGTFDGFGISGSWLGLNIKGSAVGTGDKNHAILINPFSIYTWIKSKNLSPEKTVDYFAGQIASTMLHEFTHQEVFTDYGRNFGDALTRNMGISSAIINKFKNNLISFLRRNPQTLDKLESYAQQIRPTADNLYSDVSTSFEPTIKQENSKQHSTSLQETGNRSTGDISGSQERSTLGGSTTGGMDVRVKPRANEGGFINFGKRTVEKSKVAEPINNKFEFSLGPLSPQIDKVRRSIKGQDGVDLSEGLLKFLRVQRDYLGKYTESMKMRFSKEFSTIEEKIYNTLEDGPKLDQYLMDFKRKGSSNVNLPPNLKLLAKDIWKGLTEVRQDQNKLGIPVEGQDGELREGRINKYHYPEGVAVSVINKLVSEPGSKGAKQLRKDFLDFQTEVTGSAGKAQIRFNEFIDAIKSPEESNKAAHFGPIDKAEGWGIPDSWREKNPIVNLTRYYNRVARRFAHFEAIENDPKMRRFLGIKQDVHGERFDPIKTPELADVPNYRGNRHLTPVLNLIEGRRSIAELNLEAVQGAVKSGMMQSLTGAKDFITADTLGWIHANDPVQAVQATVEGWRGIKNNIAESTRKGVNRLNFGSFETIQEQPGEIVNDLTALLHNTRDIVNKVSGRSWLERLSRSKNFGQGQFFGMDNLWRIHKGQRSKQSLDFFNKFAKGIDWKQYIAKGEFPKEVLDEISAQFVGNVQGNYDYSGLPRVTQEGSMSAVFALTRWNVEKANNFTKNVINPMLEGNFTPALMATLGTVIGGTAVNELVEFVTSRKGKQPTIREVKQGFEDKSENRKEMLFYKVAGLASAAGYAGMLGDLVKTTTDIALGNRPQSMLSNPALDAITDLSVDTIHAAQAFWEGEEDVAFDYIGKVISNTIQNYRILLAQLGPETKEKISKANQNRDLRTFRQMHDLPVNRESGFSSIDFNPFLGKDRRRFKDTQDINEAANILPREFNRIVKDSNGDPFKAEKSFEGLGKMPVRSMPSPDNDPLNFMRYLKWVENTQGKEEAAKKLQNYVKQRVANEAKREMMGLED